MTLEPGIRLGPYEIESPIGAGGMGEIYRARDTRLQRFVAIKLLSPTLADRPEQHQRLRVEARAISSLQHPHICTLLDVGEQEGRVFLVMEYLEGETLDDRLAGGALAARDVLTYALQIASALDHAHRAGIVHRDLKPSNVMLTESGAKLLDFGIARGPALTLGNGSTTITFPAEKLTTEGTIAGTYQHMAPEQLEGKSSDQRSDLFAFGTVLFEMATGRSAFEGTSQASLITSIMTGQPPAISTTRGANGVDALPDGFDRVVERCLAKDPNERWQSARDLKAELTWISEGRSSRTLHVAGASRLRAREVLAWAVGAVAIVAAAAVAWVLRSEPAPELTRFSIALPGGSVVPRTRGDATFLAVAPNGRHVAYVANTGGRQALWVHSFDGVAPRLLVSGQPVLSPFWSPDSRFIGYFAPAEGALKKVEASGGPARTIVAARNSGRPYWAGDGTIVYSEFRRGLFRVSADGGTAEQITTVDAALREINHYFPSLLLESRQLLYMATRLDENGRRATPIVYLASLETGERTEIARVNSSMVYSPPAHVMYVHEGALMAQTLDLDNRRLTGEPARLVETVDYIRSTGAASFSVSSTGVLVYQGTAGALELTWLDRSGTKLGTVGEPSRFGQLRIAPDGQRVVVDVTDVALGSADLWVYDLPRAVATRLTTDLNDERLATWAPDGQRVAFGSDRGTGSDASGDFFVKRADGMGDEQPLFVKVGPQFIEDWAPDDRSIVYREDSRVTGGDLWILPLQGAQAPRAFLQTRFEESGARFSPDSRWIAFSSNESGATEVYLAPVEGLGTKQRISTSGGVGPRWRADGKELFYLSNDGKSLMAVPVTLKPTLTIGTPAALFAIGQLLNRVDGGVRNVAYDVMPDGQRFLFSVSPNDAPSSRIEVVLNWPGLLAR